MLTRALSCKSQLLSLIVLVAVVGVMMLPTMAWAQADTFKIDYFANTFSKVDGTLRISNPGTNGGGPGVGGDMCANIYVFRNDQQMAECCSCLVTPDGLRTLSVKNDLTDNPLTPGIPRDGVVKLVSSDAAAGCNAAVVAPVPAIRAWGTHVNIATGSGAVFLTDVEAQDATLSTDELNTLQSQCQFIQTVGSGHGICSCGFGD